MKLLNKIINSDKLLKVSKREPSPFYPSNPFAQNIYLNPGQVYVLSVSSPGDWRTGGGPQ